MSENVLEFARLKAQKEGLQFERIRTQLEFNLDFVCNASALTNEEYALIRKDSFGASDSSILCEVNLYKNKDQLVEEKKNKFLTEDEKAIGKKPAVMKGKDLEPLILQKFTEKTGLNLLKPAFMYRHKEFNYLTINFDGLAILGGVIPVEAKYVTKYGTKYYDLSKAVTPEHPEQHKEIKHIRGMSMQDHIKSMAAMCGVPGYYYTQVQQQILFLDTEADKCTFGYLTALFDETWELAYFYIPRDDFTISCIVSEGAKLFEKIK